MAFWPAGAFAAGFVIQHFRQATMLGQKLGSSRSRCATAEDRWRAVCTTSGLGMHDGHDRALRRRSCSGNDAPIARPDAVGREIASCGIIAPASAANSIACANATLGLSALRAPQRFDEFWQHSGVAISIRLDSISRRLSKGSDCSQRGFATRAFACLRIRIVK